MFKHIRTGEVFTSIDTQLGGWIQVNSNLAAGPVRIILNEVTSGNPTILQGYIEVGGSRLLSQLLLVSCYKWTQLGMVNLVTLIP